MKAHDFAKDDQVDLEHTEPVFVSLLSGQSCECASSKERTVRQLKEEAQQNLGIAIKSLIGPNMEVLDEEKTLEDENIVPGTRLTLVAVNQEAEDEEEAAECGNDIFNAARDGLPGAVRHILRTDPGAVAAAGLGGGGTALHAAALFGRVEVCRLLLAAGAQVDARSKFGYTPLDLARGHGHTEVVRLLEEDRAHQAKQAKADEAEAEQFRGATRPSAREAQEAADAEEAAKCRNDIVQAARDGLLGAVRHLLRTQPGAAAATDAAGFTALHWAAQFGPAEIAQLLLAAEAQVDARNAFGNTPLHHAAYNGKAELVKLLVEAKASTTLKNNDGQTPLDDARKKGHSEIVRILESAA